MAGIRRVTLGRQLSPSSLLEVPWAQLDKTLMKGGSPDDPNDNVVQHCSLLYIGIIGTYSLSLVHFF